MFILFSVFFYKRILTNMKSLGNYYHDFPKLAKQTGYFFHLYRGKVNWDELEELNLDDITENKNFELLEQNLVNVINCNLERECDLNVQDKNFVKLFKLAQLGIDYLSFCELYLDKCVILLQEQLFTFQEKCELLRRENQKKNEELRRKKKKFSNSNYQCEKCEKFFISEFYLKGHDKRRHSNPTTPNISARKYTVKKQQTDRDEDKPIKLSPIVTTTENCDTENYVVAETKKLECDNLVKIKTLEKNLEELENRLKKAESLSLKTSQSSTNSFPCSQLLRIYYPQIPSKDSSCFFHSELCCPKNNRDSYLPDSFPKHLLPTGSSTLESTNIKILNPENLQSAYSNFRINESKETEERKIENIEDFQIPKKKFLNKCRSTTTLQMKDDSSENYLSTVFSANFKTAELNEKLWKTSSTSLPFQIMNQENKVNFEKIGNISIFNDSVAPGKIESKTIMNLVDINEINPSNNFITEDVRKSDFKLIGKKRAEESLARQNLNKTFMKSLSGLSGVVFTEGSNFNSKQKEIKNLKKIAEDKLNHQLRSLGVDPEWSILPKKTMIQSFKSLEQQRKFLTKENSMYPTVRKTLEKWIFRQVSKKHENFEENEEDTSTEQKKNVLNGYQNTLDHSLENIKPLGKNVNKAGQMLMYDIERESESELEMEDNNSNRIDACSSEI